ncbi:MAG: mechanosensitive ion channel family protein [Candidatus Eisenbacteria bacterium]
MNEYIGYANAALFYLVIYLAAGALCAFYHRRSGGDRDALHVSAGSLRRLLGSVLRPVAVLLLTQLGLRLLRFDGSAPDWIALHSSHVTAWSLFWIGALVVQLAEGLAREVYTLRKRPFPIPDLLFGILRALLLLAIAFAVLRVEMGIDIAPLLASTALLTAVVGFALQGVLGNLLAGMSLHIVKTILPSEWVIIGDVEGRVVRTNWRETRLRSRDGHSLIVPNSKVAESLINNMVQPDSRRRHKIHVGASYADAPDEVIAALVEAAESVPEVMRHPAPDAFIVEFQDYGINYRLRFWTDQYSRRAEIEGNVGRMIWYQFKRRGIEIPFPMSDQLLNDFMAVVYNQRHMQPEQRELDSRVSDLGKSDFCGKLCVDKEGAPLLSDEDLAIVAPFVRRVRYTHGETLFRQGDGGESFYVVVKGKLRGRIDQGQGVPATEFELGPGVILGEMSLMTGLPRTATIDVTESAELLRFDQEAFGLVLGLHPDIPEILSRLAADRAAQNAADLERLVKLRSESTLEDLKQPNILKRFMKMIRRTGAPPAR